MWFHNAALDELAIHPWLIPTTKMPGNHHGKREVDFSCYISGLNQFTMGSVAQLRAKQAVRRQQREEIMTSFGIGENLIQLRYIHIQLHLGFLNWFKQLPQLPPSSCYSCPSVALCALSKLPGYQNSLASKHGWKQNATFVRGFTQLANVHRGAVLV